MSGTAVVITLLGFGLCYAVAALFIWFVTLRRGV